MSSIHAINDSGGVANQVQQTVSIVIPVYNESGNIRPLVNELADVVELVEFDYEVLWVNDGSTDDTADVIDNAAKLFPSHRAIHLRHNCGQSAAMAAGFDAATGEIVVPMDGDGQNDPADIPRLVSKLENEDYDCVSGNRVSRSDSVSKRIPSNIQTHLTQQMCRDAGSDFGCTLKAYRADAIDDIDLRGEHHRYIPAQLAAKGYKLTEMDVNHRERENGNTKYGAGRLLRGFLDAVYHLLMVRYGTRPIHLFGSIGLLMLAVGGLLGVQMLIERLLLLNPIGQHLPRLILITILVLGGLLVFILGVLSEFLTRMMYRDERPYRISRITE